MNHPIDNSICSSTDLYNHVGYFPSHKYHIKEKDLYYKLGRMYGKGSIQLLSKEIRSILFKDNKYHDFDIQNSHPTLLLEFCNKCKIKSPMLEKYVRERKNFISKLQNSQIPNLSYEQVKKMILKTFNQTPAQLKHSIEKEYKHNKTLTENLSGLHSEVLLAQLKLYDLVLKNSEYSKYKLLFLTHLLQVEFPGRLVCMMANYLQHQETKELLKIFEFIKAQLEIDCKEEINSCFPKYLSKENIFSPFDFNLFIPFFDGFYFSSSNHKIQKRVEELVEKYNNNKKQSDRHLLFVKKEIAVEYKNIDYNLFQKVSNLLYILNESSFQKLTSLRKLLGHENVDLGIQLDKHSDSVHNTSKNNRPELVKTSKTKKKKKKVILTANEQSILTDKLKLRKIVDSNRCKLIDLILDLNLPANFTLDSIILKLRKNKELEND